MPHWSSTSHVLEDEHQPHLYFSSSARQTPQLSDMSRQRGFEPPQMTANVAFSLDVLAVYIVSPSSCAFTLVTRPSTLNWQTKRVCTMNCPMMCTFTRTDFFEPAGTRISDPSPVTLMVGQKPGPDR
uniref:Uncharacterized protein n=1 Tax=Anopheles melas TaxID=34690 RepID=A0A182TUU3_9DIPT